MSQLANLKSRVVPLPVDDVDTDQIIPARFLKVTDKTGLGENLFADWRRNADGALRADFPLNRPEHAGAEILLAGHNFGCGSSREHAPWALVGHGIRAVVATSFADIFRQNALKNGLLPVVVDRATSAALFAAVAADPATEIAIDLDAQTIEHAPSRTRATFPLDAFAKHCLATGTDELGYLLAKAPAITAFEASHG